MIRRVVLAGVALALTAGVSACGSSSTSGKGSTSSAAATPSSSSAGSASPSSTPSTASASDSTSVSSSSSAEAAGGGGPTGSALEALVVQASDVPGYTGDGSGSADSKSDGSDATDDAEVAACLGVGDPDQYWLAGYSSDEFTKGTVAIDSDVTSYTSTKAIDIDRSLVANPARTAQCFEREFQSSSDVPSGSTIGSVSLVRVPGAPANVLGDIKIVVTTTESGQKTKVYLDLVLIVGQHVDEALTFTSALTPFPAAELSALATVIAGRIAAA